VLLVNRFQMIGDKLIVFTWKGQWTYDIAPIVELIRYEEENVDDESFKERFTKVVSKVLAEVDKVDKVIQNNRKIRKHLDDNDSVVDVFQRKVKDICVLEPSED